MRTVPRTPKAGSILVARTVGDADGEVEDVLADALILDVGVAIVRVTLKTVGRTVTRGTVWAPEVVMVVVVKDDVSLMTVTLGETAVVEGTEELDDCAETETTKGAMRRKGRTALEASHGRHQVRGNMMVDGGRKRKSQGTEANK
jgi:hypothetical protein